MTRLETAEKHTPDVAFIAISAIIGQIFGVVIDWSWNGELDNSVIQPNLAMVVGAAIGGVIVGRNFKN